ncbi:MAG: hypothetical protein ACE5ES_05825 [Candidatus Nanoarchaeia archaeon]
MKLKDFVYWTRLIMAILFVIASLAIIFNWGDLFTITKFLGLIALFFGLNVLLQIISDRKKKK